MTLMAVGQCNDAIAEQDIFRRALAETKLESPKICVITTGTVHAKEWTEHYKNLFAALLVADVQFSHVENRAETRTESEVAKAATADIIVFTDGDPLRLTSLLGATPLMAAIEQRHNDGALIVGVREGAAALPELMIWGGDTKMEMTRNGVLFAAGLGLIDRIIFDTHKSEEKRMMRLFNALSTNPVNTGVGLGKNSAVIIRDKQDIEVIGTGMVSAIDASHCTTSNFTEIDTGETIKLEGAITHTLFSGQHYQMRSRNLFKH